MALVWLPTKPTALRLTTDASMISRMKLCKYYCKARRADEAAHNNIISISTSTTTLICTLFIFANNLYPPSWLSLIIIPSINNWYCSWLNLTLFHNTLNDYHDVPKANTTYDYCDTAQLHTSTPIVLRCPSPNFLSISHPVTMMIHVHRRLTADEWNND